MERASLIILCSADTSFIPVKLIRPAVGAHVAFASQVEQLIAAPALTRFNAILWRTDADEATLLGMALRALKKHRSNRCRCCPLVAALDAARFAAHGRLFTGFEGEDSHGKKTRLPDRGALVVK